MIREYNVLLIGDVAVGKSSLVMNHKDFQRTMMSYIPTVGVDLAFKRFFNDNGKVTLKIWDFSGSESYHFMLQSYIVRADFVIYCFDVTNAISFHNLEHRWMSTVERCSPKKIPGMLVSMKTDQRRVITMEEASYLAAAKNLRYLETSNVTQANVDRCFFIVFEILESKRPDEPIVPRSILPPHRNMPCCFQ